MDEIRTHHHLCPLTIQNKKTHQEKGADKISCQGHQLGIDDEGNKSEKHPLP